MKPLLTVFTPAFNRVDCLRRCYESLRRQTCREFIWLVVDDGSSDDTGELVRGWMQEGELEIRYHYQENGGMHTAHNAAYELVETELNVCLDSDDRMPEDAVASILEFWERHGNDRVAGLVGLDADVETGELIGTAFEADALETTLTGFYAAGGRGDKKLVYRTALMKQLPPYPVFPGEKYVGLGYKYMLADRIAPLLTMNKVLCLVEYREDGSSRNMFRQYVLNPRGFAFLRKEGMQYQPSKLRRFLEAAHYVSASLLARNPRFLQESPRPWLTLAAVPLGAALMVLIIVKNKRKG
ncbi:glycosyltransferase family 2 protein [uncultured Akkermansia sp.]|uniref:glycosyltransferase family 2 protein n=1 Tax=uncultured Akkermansia sp. TaxID=512294 RepID=UPI00265D2AE5|nr:glycosyltransferase family 2 protein [uncultured Akkermansia sp.]